MNFLKRRTSWSNFDLGIIKICVASLGISIGAYFHEYIEDDIAIFLGIYLITGAYLLWLWLKQLNRNSGRE